MGNLVIDGLTKIFDDDTERTVAVNNLDLDIEDGEFVVLVGPSGCGKTTTLRCIGGLETVSEGDIRVNGTSVVNRKPKDRNMAMVFQNYALYPHMTARENMSFGLRMTTDLTRDEIDGRVEDTAEMMGIRSLLDNKPGELSGGQQQRVALGRAIVREPEVFLMDEPLSNLDAKLRTQMRTEIQELQQRLDVTTIYVTHDQTEAMTMGDRIAILRDGELQQIGTPLECYHWPVNRFVAGFIGSPSMNFMDVRWQGDTALHHDSFDYTLSSETAERLKAAGASQELILGIRPEDIRRTDGDASDNVVQTKVNVVEPLGESTYVYFPLSGATYTASINGKVLFSEGDRFNLVFPEELIHLFDGQTGEAVKTRETTIDEEQTSAGLSREA